MLCAVKCDNKAELVNSWNQIFPTMSTKSIWLSWNQIQFPVMFFSKKNVSWLSKFIGLLNGIYSCRASEVEENITFSLFPWYSEFNFCFRLQPSVLALKWTPLLPYRYKTSFGLQMRSFPKSASRRCTCIFRSISP